MGKGGIKMAIQVVVPKTGMKRLPGFTKIWMICMEMVKGRGQLVVLVMVLVLVHCKNGGMKYIL